MKITTFGKHTQVTLYPGLGKAVWFARTFRIDGPIPDGFQDQPEGTLPASKWERRQAGLAVSEPDQTPVSFPAQDEFRQVATTTTAVLKPALTHCLTSTGTNSPRNYGTVVALDGTNVVGTAGFRLHYAALPCDLDTTLCLRRDDVTKIVKCLQGRRDCALAVSSDTLRIEAGAWTVYILTAPVRYPKYTQVMPQGDGHPIGPLSKQDHDRMRQAAKVSRPGEGIEFQGHRYNPKYIQNIPAGANLTKHDDMLEFKKDHLGGVVMRIKDNN